MVRFEWLSWHPHFGKEEPPMECALWSNGESTHSWFLNQERTAENLLMAIGAVTGVSNGSVHLILMLLLPEYAPKKFIWSEMKDIRLLKEEVIHKCPCYHLLGSTRKPEDTEAWISKDEFMVRRLRKHTEHTEEERKALFDRVAKAVEKAGRPIDEALSAIKGGSDKYSTEYSYVEVDTNIALDDELFTHR